MKLRTYLLFLPLLMCLTACGQTNGHFVRVNTVTEVFFSQDSILNIVTTDTTFTDTVGIGNTGGGQLESLDVAKRSSTSTQAVNGSWAAIPLQTEVIAGQGITYDGANQSRLTVDADGIYWVGGYVTVQSGAQRPQTAIQIRVNGSPVGNLRSSSYIRNSGVSWDYWVMEVANTPLELSAGDYVEFFVAQVTLGIYDAGGSAAVTLSGTSSEFWIAKLNGATGATGSPGSDGADGLSAYEIWLAAGNSGTEADFLASLEGEPGPAGGPVGPPGPAGAGVYSGTTSHQLETDELNVTGVRVVTSTNREGFVGVVEDGTNNPEVQMTFNDDGEIAGVVSAGRDNVETYTTRAGFTATGEGTRIYGRGGLEISLGGGPTGFARYSQDYSTDLVLNDRNIPDVGTVQGMIDAGGGGSPPIPEFIESLTSFTVNAVPHSSYLLRSENAGIKVLTLNKGVMQPGDWIIINQGSTFSADDCRIDASDGMRFHLVAGVTTSQTFGFGSTMMFVWDGTNWLVTYTN